jgi:hypothetical protein
MNHLSIDIETLDVDPSANAGVIAVGAVVFTTTKTIDRFLWILDPMWTPGSRSKSTYDWWMTQPPGTMFTGTTFPWNFCPEFSSFVGMNNVKYAWGYPARFDLGHIRSLFAAMQAPFPINFQQERDMTTLLSVAKQLRPDLSLELDEIRSRNEEPHNALADAENQAARLQHVFRALGIYRE